jgi:DNA-binding NtrC family response regulator
LLISDILMPGITGIETAIELRTAFPSCRVLLFSGQASTANMLEKARARGYEFEILAKPVHPSDLLACMRAAVPPTGLDQPRLAAPCNGEALSSD